MCSLTRTTFRIRVGAVFVRVKGLGFENDAFPVRRCCFISVFPPAEEGGCTVLYPGYKTMHSTFMSRRCTVPSSDGVCVVVCACIYVCERDMYVKEIWCVCGCVWVYLCM